MKNIVFITDVWEGQNVSGVITWLINMQAQLKKLGYNVTVIHPEQFKSLPLPGYPEIRMARITRKHIANVIREAHPDYIHIVTEGSLCFAARLACVKYGWKFTAFYHTRIPEYAAVRFRPLGWPLARYMKWFHIASACTMVSTETLKQELEQKGFKNVCVSPLGVDLDLFHRNPNAELPKGLTRPVFTFMGRLAPEKTVEDFLDCDLPGSKMIIGDGPSKVSLERQYQGKAFFAGHKTGQELVDLLSASDVYVFPSRTDTFSLTTIEALACGLPVAAYDVQGPKNIITNGYDGYLGENLKENALKCLTIDRANCVKVAEKYSWEHAVSKFLENLAPIN
jgi:glycosyltransferase involved in cell wall biosynthesis